MPECLGVQLDRRTPLGWQRERNVGRISRETCIQSFGVRLVALRCDYLIKMQNPCDPCSVEFLEISARKLNVQEHITARENVLFPGQPCIQKTWLSHRCVVTWVSCDQFLSPGRTNCRPQTCKLAERALLQSTLSMCTLQLGMWEGALFPTARRLSLLAGGACCPEVRPCSAPPTRADKGSGWESNGIAWCTKLPGAFPCGQFL